MQRILPWSSPARLPHTRSRSNHLNMPESQRLRGAEESVISQRTRPGHSRLPRPTIQQSASQYAASYQSSIGNYQETPITYVKPAPTPCDSRRGRTRDRVPRAASNGHRPSLLSPVAASVVGQNGQLGSPASISPDRRLPWQFYTRAEKAPPGISARTLRSRFKERSRYNERRSSSSGSQAQHAQLQSQDVSPACTFGRGVPNLETPPELGNTKDASESSPPPKDAADELDRPRFDSVQTSLDYLLSEMERESLVVQGEAAQQCRRSNSQWRVRRGTDGSINDVTGDYGMVTPNNGTFLSITEALPVVDEDAVSQSGARGASSRVEEGKPIRITLRVVNNAHADTCICRDCIAKRARRRLKCCDIEARITSLAWKLQGLRSGDVREDIDVANDAELADLHRSARDIAEHGDCRSDNRNEAGLRRLCRDIKAMEIHCRILEAQARQMVEMEAQGSEEAVSDD